MTTAQDFIDMATASLNEADNALIGAYGKLGEEEAAKAALQQAYDELKAKYDALVNPTPPPPVNPSGQAMPTTDLPGYRLAWSEDFNTPASEGQIRDVYGNKMMFYPPRPDQAYYTDTSKRGRYETKNLSAAGGCLRYHVYTSSDGIHHVGAILPTLSPKDAEHGQYGSVSGGRFAVRFRSAKLPTYKIAWLLWPKDGDWPKNGEIDFPEASLSGTSTIKGFMHRQDAVPEEEGGLGGKDQDSVSTSAFPTDWHTCVMEWDAGRFCRFILDGTLIKSITSRVPETPMRWTLQTETSLDKAVTINNSANGYVEIDWLAYWAPV